MVGLRAGWGEVYVNGQRVHYPADRGEARRMNLGGPEITSHAGSVGVTTGLFNNTEQPGEQTRYEGFRGYTYDHGC